MMVLGSSSRWGYEQWGCKVKALKQQYEDQWAGSDKYNDFDDYHTKRMSEIIESEKNIPT